MKVDNEMGAQQIARLTVWLQKKGLTLEEVIECIDYIAYGENQKHKATKSGPSNARTKKST